MFLLRKGRQRGGCKRFPPFLLSIRVLKKIKIFLSGIATFKNPISPVCFSSYAYVVLRTYPETTCGLCDTPLGPPLRGELKGDVRCRGRFLDRLLCNA